MSEQDSGKNQFNIDVSSGMSNIQNEKFNFTCKGWEFFQIWIVNICLTILTLGIYSAWAKVRTKQYFYSNTLLRGSSFQYLADPVKVLKGRAIAVLLFILYSVVTQFSPFTGVVILAAFVLAVPAILVMSFSFNMTNSAFRNVRFGYRKDYRQGYKIFAVPVLYFILWVVTSYLFIPVEGETATVSDWSGGVAFAVIIPMAFVFLYPWFEYLVLSFRLRNSLYGQSIFVWNGSAGQLYSLYFKASLGFVVVILLASILFVIIAFLVGITVLDEDAMELIKPFAPLLFFLILPVYLWLFAFIKAKKYNIIINNLDLAGNKLSSDMSVSYVLFLYVTNTLAIVLSFGLLIPWSLVRTARYAASVTSVAITDLENFIKAEEEHQNALGEEMGDIFDVDIGF